MHSERRTADVGGSECVCGIMQPCREVYICIFNRAGLVCMLVCVCVYVHACVCANSQPVMESEGLVMDTVGIRMRVSLYLNTLTL